MLASGTVVKKAGMVLIVVGEHILNTFQTYFYFSLTMNVSSGIKISDCFFQSEFLLYFLIFLPPIFLPCHLPMWCLFSYNFL